MAGNTENIKERLSVEEVVGHYVELKPSGINLKGKCPFHSEKTPSFMVSPERQTYHCFGCGVGGDIFTFVQEIEGLDFKGALKLLADKAGVELEFEKQNPEEKDEKETLFTILEIVTQYYEENLTKNAKALTYLKDRGFSEETIKNFRIGFALDSWDGALSFLKSCGFSESDIEKAGLSKSGDKGSYDRFRSRIMFPVADSVGRIVAFSGRIFDKEDDNTGKYINSPETALYHKSKILYGYDRARQAIRKIGFSILVEGQMDLIATHQAGYTNTVALSGTALTPEHITLLSRMAKKLVIALDADEAGITSAGKSARAALRAGFDVKIAVLPEGTDPADLLATGKTAEWKAVVKNSKHVVEFMMDIVRGRAKDERAFKLATASEVLPFLHDISNEIDQTHFIQKVANQLSVEEAAVRRELGKIAHTKINTGTTNQKRVAPDLPKPKAEDEVIRMYLWQRGRTTPHIDVDALQTRLETVLTPVGFEALVEKHSSDTQSAFRFEQLFTTDLEAQGAIDELIERLGSVKLRDALQKASEALRKAESTGNKADIEKYSKECQELHLKLSEL